jgi:hypothetical protein
MNKFILTILMILWLYAAMAAEQPKVIKTVPANISAAFKTKYPDAAHLYWMNDGGNYAARFYSRGEPCTARFNNKAEWLDETKKLSFGELRNNVRNAFSQSKFAGWRAHEVNSITERNKEVEYRILILNNTEKKYIYYDAKGQLKKEVMTM